MTNAIDEKMDRRAMEVGRNPTLDVIDKRPCYETGAGVIITKSKRDRSVVTAYFFKSRQLKNAFVVRPLKSAHERVAVDQTLKDLINTERSQAMAPHNLKVGDIISDTWGATMRRVTFYVVTNIPSPRKVNLCQIRSKYISGDHHEGQMVPEELSNLPSDANSNTYNVVMKGDVAYVKMSYEQARVWDGKPVHTYSD